MRRCTVYPHCVYFVTSIYHVKAFLETLSRWGILTIYRAETYPRWHLNVLFFKQLYAGLQKLAKSEIKWTSNTLLSLWNIRLVKKHKPELPAY
jgi:hypothetical protein